jgi:hypothetical protein
MMRAPLFLAIMVCTAGLTSVEGSDLGFRFDGNTYLIITSAPLPWAEAEAAAGASSIGGVAGRLCVIDSEAENVAVFDVMVLAGVNTVSPDGGGGIYGWLGGSDDPASVAGAAEGEWFWVDIVQFWTGGQSGTPVGGAYSNWGRPQEPDNYGNAQHHLGLSVDGWPFGDGGEWNDINGGSFLAYCVEFEGVIFADGFESGDLSAWLTGAPG